MPHRTEHYKGFFSYWKILLAKYANQATHYKD
jgi:hypothetical protein